MWSDNESEIDLVGCSHLVHAVLQVARNDALLPATIGVFGDWGSGKSSILRLVKSQLEADRDTLVVSFNGWLFEGYEEGKTALLGTILDKVADEAKLTDKGQKLLGRLLRRVNWLKVVAATVKGGAGLAVAGPIGLSLGAGDAFEAFKGLTKKVGEENIDEIQEFIKSDVGREIRKDIREFRDDFRKLLKETGRKRLVVLIDDLDRCMPDTIIAALEAIKLFLFVEQSAFVIGADERLVRYAVRRRFPELPGERVEVGRDYLEKLVQFPVRVPPLGQPEVEVYLGLLLLGSTLSEEDFEHVRQVAVAHRPIELGGSRLTVESVAKVTRDVSDQSRMALLLAGRLAPAFGSLTTGNPRQCKRFLNTLTIRVAMAKSREVELTRDVLAKLMLLEYFRGEAFGQLAASQAEQGGMPRELLAAEAVARGSARPPKAAAAESEGRTGEAEKSTPAGVEGGGTTGKQPSWLEDAWVRDWLVLEPALGGLDLRPYFYFSRETLGGRLLSAQRLSPEARTLIQQLLGQSEAIRRAALTKAAQLSPGDASAVFDSLAAKARAEEDHSAAGSGLGAVLKLLAVRQELLPQLPSLLSSLPDASIPLDVPPRVVDVAEEAGAPDIAREVLSKWISSTVPNLKKATASALKRLSQHRES